jgi:UDP-4-amino-4,6-dideoxy-N-acetyl-beta-L-altrosamine transaminase
MGSVAEALKRAVRAIPYGRQDVSEDDIDAVIAVLRSDFLTQGACVPAFEAALYATAEAKHAVAVSSATAALHVACLALDLGPGDLLWTSPNTFVASANCALYCGADVDFVDVDASTHNMSAPALAAKLAQAERDGRLPKIVVPVHFGGLSCDMQVIKALGDRYGFRIIEDASHAIGGRYRDEPVGCCRYSDIAVFSFHPVKIVTTGEGGAALTNDARLAERMVRLRSHGITRDESLMDGAPEGSWYYQMLELGFNYRMTDIQAALGLSQLDRLGDFVKRRTQLADRYDRMLASSGLALPARDPSAASAWHLYTVGWNEQASGVTRGQAFARLRESNINANVHYIPVHLQPYYRQRGFRAGQFPNAEAYYASALTLPLYPSLTESEQDIVADCLMSMAVR